MSMITRCPACQTLFKVVPDQLRISDGWVRCGQCQQIFDARPQLLPLDRTSAIPSATNLPDEPGDYAQTPEQPQQTGDLTTALPDLACGAELKEELALADNKVELVVERESELEAGSGAALSQVSFLRDASSGSFWRKPIIRIGLLILALSLTLALLVQIVFHERHRILAMEPGLKPWLQAFCAPLNCTVSALRRIDSIVIDSASFTKIRADTYRLNFTVKNAAVIALAAPAIELTLTDSLDRALVRRVFQPGEFGVKTDALAASSEWPASVAISVKSAGLADRVLGYRLLAFYP
jgi:predicted Zn finger-like uncharacterized protein